MWLFKTRRRAIDGTRVREAIEAAERRTSAEIVVSVAPFFLGNIWKAAEGAFVRLGVARTRARNGVLVFVIPSRRQLVVMGDEGIHAQLGDPFWQEVVARIATAFARGDGTGGLVEGIARLGETLAERFPRGPDDVNELADEPDGLRRA